MKRHIPIAAYLLTVYITVLPILFGLHFIEHHNDFIQKASDDSEYVEFGSDCELCDLFHNQTVATEAQITQVPDHQHTPYQLLFSEELHVAATPLKFLRGPPTA